MVGVFQWRAQGLGFCFGFVALLCHWKAQYHARFKVEEKAKAGNEGVCRGAIFKIASCCEATIKTTKR